MMDEPQRAGATSPSTPAAGWPTPAPELLAYQVASPVGTVSVSAPPPDPPDGFVFRLAVSAERLRYAMARAALEAAFAAGGAAGEEELEESERLEAEFEHADWEAFRLGEDETGGTADG